MNKQYQSICAFAILFGCFQAFAESSESYRALSFFSYRSQTYDAARELVGWANDYHINLFDMCDYYGSFSATPEYTSSFRPAELVCCLLADAIITSDCSTATLCVQGSQVSGRVDRAIFADYFGLPTDYQSTITLSPRISNILVDYNWYMGLDPWIEGLYFRIHSPVVYTRWDLGACESIYGAGTNAYEPGYFAPIAIPRTTLNPSALSFLSGNNTSGHAHIDALHCARWNACSYTRTKPLTEIKLSDVVMALGCNFLQCEDYHFGLNVRISIPAGTRPHGVYFFEPIIGNGHHVGCGAGISSHIMLWRDCEYESYFGLYVDINLLHLFNTTQKRVFDLRGKPNSRYMLAARVPTSAFNSLQGNITSLTGMIQPGFPPVVDVSPTDGYQTSPAQFKQQYTPVANLTYSTVCVDVPIQGNIALLFDYTHGDWSLDIGYSFFGRSPERITIENACTQFEKDTWVLKGDASMYGYPLANWTDPIGAFPFTGLVTQGSKALAASEQNATIFHGTNRAHTASAAPSLCTCNQGIDNAVFAFTDPVANVFSGVLNPIQAQPLYTATPLTTIIEHNQQTRISLPPRYITRADFDCDASATYISNSLFIHASYTWSLCEPWVPYCGAGSQIEFGQTSTPCASTISTRPTECDKHTHCAVSQWGIWLKLGISFH